MGRSGKRHWGCSHQVGLKILRDVLNAVPVMFPWRKGASCVSLCQYLSLVTLQTGCVQYGTQKWAVGGEPGKRTTCFSSCPLVMGIYGIVFKIGTVSLKLMGLAQELFSSGYAP